MIDPRALPNEQIFGSAIGAFYRDVHARHGIELLLGARQQLLAASREGGDVVLTVRDTGVGIPPETLPEMFELFAQGDRTLARSEKSTRWKGFGAGRRQKKSHPAPGRCTVFIPPPR